MKALLDMISPATWYVAVIAAVVFVLHLNYQEGYETGFALAQADGKTAIAKLRQEYAQEKQHNADAATDAAKQAIADLVAEQARGQELARQLAEAKKDLRKTTDKLKGDIPRVTTDYRRSLVAQPEPLPVGVFTAGFVRVWNEALSSGAVPSGQSTGRAADSAGGAGAADQLISGVTQPDILENHVRNGERYGSCRAQLKRLIEWNIHGRI